jgi:hypothetical protein
MRDGRKEFLASCRGTGIEGVVARGVPRPRPPRAAATEARGRGRLRGSLGGDLGSVAVVTRAALLNPVDDGENAESDNSGQDRTPWGPQAAPWSADTAPGGDPLPRYLTRKSSRRFRRAAIASGEVRDIVLAAESGGVELSSLFTKGNRGQGQDAFAGTSPWPGTSSPPSRCAVRPETSPPVASGTAGPCGRAPHCS